MVKRVSPEKAAELVEELKAEIAKAEGELANRATEESGLILDVRRGVPGADLALAKVQKSMESADRLKSNAEKALKAAQERYSEELRAAREAELALRWKVAEELAEKRRIKAKELERLASELAETFKQFMKINSDAFTATPSKDSGFEASLLSHDHVVGDFRLQLRKLGFRWAKDYIWADTSIPDFSSRVEEGNAWLLKYSPSKREQGGEAKQSGKSQ